MSTAKKDSRIHFRSDAEFDQKLATALKAFNKKNHLDLKESEFIRMCVVKFTEDILAQRAAMPYPEYQDSPLALVAEDATPDAPVAKAATAGEIENAEVSKNIARLKGKQRAAAKASSPSRSSAPR